MKNLKFCSVAVAFCLLIFLFAAPAAQALENPDVTAEAVYLIDTQTQQVLYSTHAEETVNPAQLAPMVTALLTMDAIEQGTLSRYDSVIVPPKFAQDLDDTAIRCGLVEGETVTIESLLYCAILEQAQDACNVLAISIAGSVPDFVEQMDAYAEQLGCTDTAFSSPGASTDKASSTTARDAALIAQAATAYPLFEEIIGTESYDLPETDKNSGRTILGNTALTSSMDADYYLYVKSFIASVDETAIFATASNEEISLLAIVFGAEAGTCYSTAATLFDWVFNHFQYSDVLAAKTVIAEEPVSMAADNATVELRPSESIALLIPNKETVDFDVQYTFRDEQLTAPISTGEVLGEVSVLHDGVVCGHTNLVAANAVSRSESQYLRAQLISTLFRPASLIIIALVLILLALYILSVVHYRKTRRAYLRRKTAMAHAANLPQNDMMPASIPDTGETHPGHADTTVPSPEELSPLFSEATPDPIPGSEKSPASLSEESEDSASREFNKIPKRDLDDLNDLFKNL